MAETHPVTAAPRTTREATAENSRTDRVGEQRAALRLRHSRSLTALMESRRDLRGVHALADLVDDSVRWSA